MKRYLLLSTASLAGVACVVLLVLAVLPRNGATKANFDRIEMGMTRADVEVIFGSAGEPPKLMPGTIPKMSPTCYGEQMGPGAYIYFDENDMVGAKRWHSSEALATIVERCREWLSVR